MNARGGWRRRAMWMAGVAASVVCAAPAAAQPDWWNRWRPDSLGVAADAVPLALETVRAECDPPGTQVVRDSADAAEIRRFGGCDPFPLPGLGRDLYVRLVMMGDCHARHSVDAFRSDSRREYRIVTVDRYGGCRAGRIEERWIQLPPLPDGWTVAFTERRIDDRGGEPWRTDTSRVADQGEPLRAEREWIDCDAPGVRVLRDRVDLKAVEHLPGCGASAFFALGRDLYVRVLPGEVCDAPYDVHAWRVDTRREYRVVKEHTSRACRAPGGGARWYRLPPLPDEWTVVFADGPA